jgi:hypothetical protein
MLHANKKKDPSLSPKHKKNIAEIAKKQNLVGIICRCVDPILRRVETCKSSESLIHPAESVCLCRKIKLCVER